jgi:hypothetical protein
VIDFSEMKKSYYITREQIQEVLMEVEKQGGNKACAARINKIFDDVCRECEM